MKSYWKLVDLNNPEWFESYLKYNSLDEVKARVLYLTHLEDPNNPKTEIQRKTVVQFQPLTFNDWCAVEKTLFGDFKSVDLTEWFTIIKLAN